MELRDSTDALRLLVRLGAPPRLVRHHELVAEAADELIRALPSQYREQFDADWVGIAAALHDAGKIEHPAEMGAPGSLHEPAGEALLRQAGVPNDLARICVTHADWADPRATLDDHVVALADKLWKGKRVSELEDRVLRLFAERLQIEPWSVFSTLDPIFEAVASSGDDRLARS